MVISLDTWQSRPSLEEATFISGLQEFLGTNFQGIPVVYSKKKKKKQVNKITKDAWTQGIVSKKQQK